MDQVKGKETVKTTSINDLPIEIISKYILCHLGLKDCVSFCSTSKDNFKLLTDERIIKYQDEEQDRSVREVYELIRKKHIRMSNSREMFIKYIRSLETEGTIAVVTNSPLYRYLIRRDYKPKADLIVGIEFVSYACEFSEITTFYENMGGYDLDIMVHNEEGTYLPVEKAIEKIIEGESEKGALSSELMNLKPRKCFLDVSQRQLGSQTYRMDISPLLAHFDFDYFTESYSEKSRQGEIVNNRFTRLVRITYFSVISRQEWLEHFIKSWRNDIEPTINKYGWFFPTKPDIEL